MTETRRQEVIDKVRAAGQAHVLHFYDELSDESKDRLLRQLDEINYSQLTQLYEKFIQNQEPVAKGKLEPADFIPVPETQEQIAAAREARQIGEQALRRGRVAAFLVAGGQGTRLGFDDAKGKFPITPIKQKSLFQLHAEKILALSRKSDAAIPWYIMTSESNHDDTVTFFEQHDYFGLRTDGVMFFSQDMVPALDPDGKLFLDAKDHVFENPNGHGGSLSALKNSGALDDMRERGVDTIFYFQVDNVLARICDPIFIGYHLRDNADMSAKIVTKDDPDEKVGVLGTIGGRMGVIEYSDLSEEDKHARNPDGALKYRAGNTAIHVLDVDFVERENEGGLRLPWHVAHKQIPYLDEQGKLVEPEEPNGYKFETFVFDALGDADRTVFMEIERENEFSPVKNAEGKDSPATARRDMTRMYARWLEQAGVNVPRDDKRNPKVNIEISPLFALEAEDVKKNLKGKPVLSDDLYLE